MNLIKPVAPVSVIIPCFRCASTIKRAIESVAQQTQKPAEVILVDDASGDDTLSILLAIEKQYLGWVKVIALDKNSGAASARNAGWAMSNQDYIAFLDSDDSWHPNKLKIQYEYMANHPNIALSAHQCLWLHSDHIPKTDLNNPIETSVSSLSLLFRNAFSTPTVMLKSSIPIKFKDNKRYAEDLFLWQQVAFFGLQIVRIELPLAYVHKPLFGSSGLSARLWDMEKGELDNFLLLYKAGHINLVFLGLCSIFSLIKFLRRLVVTCSHRLSANKSL